jgi:hypothetical protein
MQYPSSWPTPPFDRAVVNRLRQNNLAQVFPAIQNRCKAFIEPSSKQIPGTKKTSFPSIAGHGDDGSPRIQGHSTLGRRRKQIEVVDRLFTVSANDSRPLLHRHLPLQFERLLHIQNPAPIRTSLTPQFTGFT